MFPAASYDIIADRFTIHSDYMDVVAYNFTGATCKMQVRDRANGGEIRADIVPTVTVTTVDAITTSRVTWTVPKATMVAMPIDPNNPQDDVVLYYDLHIDPTDGDDFVAWRGKFTVRAGVTE